MKFINMAINISLLLLLLKYKYLIDILINYNNEIINL